MPALDSLDAVNQMIGLVGELPINALDEPHPLIPAAITAINTAAANVQSDFWWFNVEYPTLTPQVGTGHLLVPPDAAGADSLTKCPRLAVRGNRLYNLDASTDVFTEPLRVRLHRVIAFDDLPLVVRAHVVARAKLAFQANYDGDSAKTALIRVDIQDTYTRMHAEHIRSAKVNLLNRPSTVATFQMIQGGRPVGLRY